MPENSDLVSKRKEGVKLSSSREHCSMAVMKVTSLSSSMKDADEK